MHNINKLFINKFKNIDNNNKNIILYTFESLDSPGNHTQGIVEVSFCPFIHFQ